MARRRRSPRAVRIARPEPPPARARDLLTMAVPAWAAVLAVLVAYANCARP